MTCVRVRMRHGAARYPPLVLRSVVTSPPICGRGSRVHMKSVADVRVRLHMVSVCNVTPRSRGARHAPMCVGVGEKCLTYQRKCVQLLWNTHTFGGQREQVRTR